MSRPQFAGLPERRTSVRIVGTRQVEEFDALCRVLGRRPHQLAADLVLEGIQRYRDDPDIARAVRVMVRARRRYDAGIRLVEGRRS